MAPVNSELLVRSAQAGDRSALELLIAEHLAPLHAYVRLHEGPLLRERETTTEIVNSVCREVLQDLPAFEWRGQGSFRSWLFTAARRKLVDKHRFWKRERRDPAKEHALQDDDLAADPALGRTYTMLVSPSEQAMASEEAACLERAFERLTEEQRELVLLRTLAGLTHQELADRFGIEVGAAKKRVARARAQLWTHFRAAGGGA